MTLIFMRLPGASDLNLEHVISLCLCGPFFHVSGLFFHMYAGSLLGPSPFTKVQKK